MTAMANSPQDFFRQIENDPETSCWLWRGPRTYGMYGIHWQPRRLAYRVAGKPYGKRYVIHCPHSQDCVNPEHTELATRAAWIRYIARLKRAPRKPSVSRYPCLLDYAAGMTVREIADKYSISPETASERIRSNFPDWPSVPEIRRRIKHQRPSAVEALERARQALDSGPTP